jgi:radical SAM protein with 4Fe4S-binding SPASM domain
MQIKTPDSFKNRRWDDNQISPASLVPSESAELLQAYTEIALARKYNNEGEFFINFFEKCNLSCSFCYQKHDDWTGIESIGFKANQLIKRAEDLGLAHDGYQINMMGGELFMDDVPEETFQEYKQFIIDVSTALNKKNKYTKFHFVTNLVFTKTDRVLKLLKELQDFGIEVPICISYDFQGRFNEKSFVLFQQNVELFWPWIKMVSIVLTKQNIQVLLGQRKSYIADIAYLKYLYDKNLYCYFDYFSPQHNAEHISPSDEELLAAFEYLMDHFPKSGPVQDFFDQRPQRMSCRGDQIVQPDGEVGRCRILVDKRTLNDFSSKPDNFNTKNMESRFMNEMGCLECEYFERCGLGCFLLHDFSNRKKMKSCLFKKLYKKADSVGSVAEKKKVSG